MAQKSGEKHMEKVKAKVNQFGDTFKTKSLQSCMSLKRVVFGKFSGFDNIFKLS